MASTSPKQQKPPSVITRVVIPWAAVVSLALLCVYLLVQRKEFHQQFTRLASEADVVRLSMSEAQRVRDQLQMDNDQLDARYADAHAERQRLRDTHISLEEDRQRLEAEFNALQEKSNETVEELKDVLAASRAQAKSTVDELTMQLDREKQLQRRLQEQLEASRAEAKRSELAICYLRSDEHEGYQAVAVWDALRGSGRLQVGHLPSLEEGLAYHLWLKGEESGEPIAAGAFGVSEEGTAAIEINPESAVTKVELFGITQESDPDPDAPGVPYLVQGKL